MASADTAARLRAALLEIGRLKVALEEHRAASSSVGSLPQQESLPHPPSAPQQPAGVEVGDGGSGGSGVEHRVRCLRYELTCLRRESERALEASQSEVREAKARVAAAAAEARSARAACSGLCARVGECAYSAREALQGLVEVLSAAGCAHLPGVARLTQGLGDSLEGLVESLEEERESAGAAGGQPPRGLPRRAIGLGSRDRARDLGVEALKASCSDLMRDNVRLRALTSSQAAALAAAEAAALSASGHEAAAVQLMGGLEAGRACIASLEAQLAAERARVAGLRVLLEGAGVRLGAVEHARESAARQCLEHGLEMRQAGRGGWLGEERGLEEPSGGAAPSAASLARAGTSSAPPAAWGRGSTGSLTTNPSAFRTVEVLAPLSQQPLSPPPSAKPTPPGSLQYRARGSSCAQTSPSPPQQKPSRPNTGASTTATAFIGTTPVLPPGTSAGSGSSSIGSSRARLRTQQLPGEQAAAALTRGGGTQPTRGGLLRKRTSPASLAYSSTSPSSSSSPPSDRSGEDALWAAPKQRLSRGGAGQGSARARPWGSSRGSSARGVRGVAAQPLRALSSDSDSEEPVFGKLRSESPAVSAAGVLKESLSDLYLRVRGAPGMLAPQRIPAAPPLQSSTNTSLATGRTLTDAEIALSFSRSVVAAGSASSASSSSSNLEATAVEHSFDGSTSATPAVQPGRSVSPMSQMVREVIQRAAVGARSISAAAAASASASAGGSGTGGASERR